MLIRNARVIVGDLREQARSYKEAFCPDLVRDIPPPQVLENDYSPDFKHQPETDADIDPQGG